MILEVVADFVFGLICSVPFLPPKKEFAWEATSLSGTAVSGQVKARSAVAVARRLKKQGYTDVAIFRDDKLRYGCVRARQGGSPGEGATALP